MRPEDNKRDVGAVTHSDKDKAILNLLKYDANERRYRIMFAAAKPWVCRRCARPLAGKTRLSPRRADHPAQLRAYTVKPNAQDGRPFRMAVVGSGPAGFYTSYKVMSKIENSVVDMYEHLPVPFGLVRFGVAPDHPEVKVDVPLINLQSCALSPSRRIARRNSKRSQSHHASISLETFRSGKKNMVNCRWMLYFHITMRFYLHTARPKTGL